MAVTYSNMGAICLQPDFQRRVSVAMGIAAVNIYSESSGTTGHAARALYATKVTNGTYNLGAVCLSVMQSSNIQSTSDPFGSGILDTDIQNQVNGIWNCLAGA